MSITLVLWLALFAVLVVLSFRRPIWGFGLYLLAYFAFPPYWWWGRPIVGPRWSLIAGCVFLVAVLLRSGQSPGIWERGRTLALWMAALVAVNGTFVHLFFADYAEISARHYYINFKIAVLFLLIVASLRDRIDLRIALICIALGAGYLGYEATINGRGQYVRGRLESLGAPTAITANQTACLLGTCLPLIGGFLFYGTRREKIMAFLIAPLVLNTIILTNSRSGFLGLIVAGIALVATARGSARTKAVWALVVGGLAGFMLLGDEMYMSRFKTTFAPAEERDTSAASRLDYWTAGLRMMVDYPLGAGGEGFETVHGTRYLAEMGIYYQYRAVHNGYIDEACQWGVQGLAIRLLIFAGAMAYALAALRYCASIGDFNMAFLGSCMLAAMSVFLVMSVFADMLDNEWGMWVAALAVGYARIYGRPVGQRADAQAPPPFGARSSIPAMS